MTTTDRDPGLDAFRTEVAAFLARAQDEGVACPGVRRDPAAGAPRPGAGVAAPPPRRRVRRAALAGRRRRARPRRGAPGRVERGVRPRPGHAVSQPAGPRPRRRGDPALGHRRPTPAVPAADPARRRAVVPALLRARRRVRPGQPDDARRPRRRSLRRRRAQGVVVQRGAGRVGHPAGPHRPSRARPSRHLVLPARHGRPGGRGPAHHADDRRRGVLRGRARPRRGAGDRPARAPSTRAGG